MSGIVFAGK